MFSQSAYSDPDIMRAELKTYIASKHNNLGWPQTMVNELVEQVDISFDEADSFFKFDETIVRDALRDYQEQFIRITVDFTGNPNILKNYQKVLNTISSLIETQHTVDQLSGLDLIGNVAQEQVEEFSENDVLYWKGRAEAYYTEYVCKNIADAAQDSFVSPAEGSTDSSTTEGMPF